MVLRGINHDLGLIQPFFAASVLHRVHFDLVTIPSRDMNVAIDIVQGDLAAHVEGVGLMELLGELSSVFSSMALSHGE